MNLLRVRRLFAGERVARFGTTGPGGRPHLMPVPFALIDDGDEGVIVCTLGTGGAGEPPSIAAAARRREALISPRVSFLIDRSRRTAARWWVQADAVAEVLRRGVGDPRYELAIRAIAERHGPGSRSTGTVVWGTVTAWTGWASAGPVAAVTRTLRGADPARTG